MLPCVVFFFFLCVQELSFICRVHQILAAVISSDSWLVCGVWLWRLPASICFWDTKFRPVLHFAAEFLFCPVVNTLYQPSMTSLLPSHWNVPDRQVCERVAKIRPVIGYRWGLYHTHPVCPAPLYAWPDLMTHFPLALSAKFLPVLQSRGRGGEAGRRWRQPLCILTLHIYSALLRLLLFFITVNFRHKYISEDVMSSTESI